MSNRFGKLSDVLVGMEKSNVYILDNRHWLFGNHVDISVYLSIPKFSKILELFGDKRTIASTLPFIAHRYTIISCPLIVIIIFSVDKWILAWKYMKRKISL